MPTRCYNSHKKYRTRHTNLAYIIYCDESADKGKKFADFFGGCIIDSKYLFEVESALNAKKEELQLNGEIKWTKTTANYLEKYKEIMNLFFSFVEQGKVKVRIMFRSVDDVPSVPVDNNEKYFKLYYQFIKHAFGLQYIPADLLPTNIIINLDILPDKHGMREEFKKYLREIPHTKGFPAAMTIRERGVIEVDSHDHVLLQCTDIILGAMNFRLNELHKEKPAGQRTRAKRTIAKEALYKHINKLIRKIHPHFNIGISTGARGSDNPHWESPYEHWKFIPN